MDDILELLVDGSWHRISEIAKVLHQDVAIITRILNFYDQFNFIKYDHGKERVVIDPDIKKIFLLSI